MDTSARISELQKSPEETLRVIARALAPYVADELRRLNALEQEALDPNYDSHTCRRFVAEFGDQVLLRATKFFELLGQERLVDSIQLADLLQVAPRELSGNLTTPLKRRARALNLPLPFAGGLGDKPYGGIDTPSPDMDPERTHWQDRDGIARRMLSALTHEREERHLGEPASHQARRSPLAGS